jgi:tRNA threonylcarbamoyladenosine biosynthesis protein TsaE
MVTLISNSVEETMRLGHAWGEEAQHGWVIGLRGELGAGKTQLVKGLARGLGVKDRVHSPTFTLLNEYGGGRQPLFHMDLYRLQNASDVIAAGLEEYLRQPRGVAVVEWAERWLAWPEEGSSSVTENSGFLRLVSIDEVGEDTRRFRYEDIGA